MLLEIAYEAWCAAGVKVMEDHLEVALTDPRTEVLARQQVPLKASSPQAAVRDLSNAVKALLKESSHKPQRLVGVGVGMARVMDSERGICRYSLYLHWRDVPLRDLLEERLLWAALFRSTQPGLAHPSQHPTSLPPGLVSKLLGLSPSAARPALLARPVLLSRAAVATNVPASP